MLSYGLCYDSRDIPLLLRKISVWKNIRRYYNNKRKLNLILNSVKYIIKPREKKRKEEYMVLDRKQNATTSKIFMALLDLMMHRQQHLQILNQHRQMDELVMRLIPTVTDHIVPVIVERVRELVSLPSHQPNTDMAPTVPTSSTVANIDEVHALGSNDDRNSLDSLLLCSIVASFLELTMNRLFFRLTFEPYGLR